MVTLAGCGSSTDQVTATSGTAASKAKAAKAIRQPSTGILQGKTTRPRKTTQPAGNHQERSSALSNLGFGMGATAGLPSSAESTTVVAVIPCESTRYIARPS